MCSVVHTTSEGRRDFTVYELGVWWVPLAKVASSWWPASILVAWFLLAKWLLLTKVDSLGRLLAS